MFISVKVVVTVVQLKRYIVCCLRKDYTCDCLMSLLYKYKFYCGRLVRVVACES